MNINGVDILLSLALIAVVASSCTSRESHHVRKENRRAATEVLIEKVDTANVKAAAHAANAAEFDRKIKAYRAEMLAVRANPQRPPKERKAYVQGLKRLVKQAKQARKKERLIVKTYRQKLTEYVAEFEALQRK